MNYIHRDKDELPELKKTSEQFQKEIEGMSRDKAYAHYDEQKSKLKYNTDETKIEFKNMNYERCSFCTGIIKEFMREMTVEHIELKSRVPAKIYEWSNMLCSCKACNTKRGTKAYDRNKYLNPTIVTDIDRYFKFNADGTIEPSEGLTEEEKDAAVYMIETYGLDRETLNYERRLFFNDLQDDEFFRGLLKKDLLSRRIIYRSVFTYYKKRRIDDGK